jgi:hypothetical protein
LRERVEAEQRAALERKRNSKPSATAQRNTEN